MFSLEGQKVLIIGGSYGMGYATARSPYMALISAA